MRNFTAFATALLVAACVTDTGPFDPASDAEDPFGAIVPPAADGRTAELDPRTSEAALPLRDANGVDPRALAALDRASHLVWARAAAPTNEGDALDDGVDRGHPGETFVLDDDGRIVARISAVVTAVGGRLREWSFRSVDVRRVPCLAELGALPDVDPEVSASIRESARAEAAEIAADPVRTVDQLVLVDLEGGAAQMVSDFDPRDATNDFAFSASLVGVVGRHAFLREFVWSYSCGAHGSGGSQAILLDLVTGTRIEKLPTLAAAAMTDARGEAERVFDERRREWDGTRDEDAQLVELVPRFDADARVGFDARFATFVPFAFSSGGWGSYLAATLVPTRAAAPSPIADAPVPRAVATFRRAHPDLVMIGWE